MEAALVVTVVVKSVTIETSSPIVEEHHPFIGAELDMNMYVYTVCVYICFGGQNFVITAVTGEDERRHCSHHQPHYLCR